VLERLHGDVDLGEVGLTNAEVAEELYISQATVKTHLSSVLSKLHLRDRAVAIVLAHRNQLLDD
jgi:DNA-binding NarL/FixJ family response regulator